MTRCNQDDPVALAVRQDLPGETFSARDDVAW
jgi:hypothetical protein